MNSATYKIENLIAPSALAGGKIAHLPAAALMKNIQTRVAYAMNMSPGLIRIEGHQTGFSGWGLKCWGTASRTRFFAKIFLVDPYPVPPRFATPEEELTKPEKPQRPVEKQIATEWNMLREMRSRVGTQNIPAPLGWSIDGRILVFEEVKGLRVDQFVKWRWPGGRKMSSVETAMQQAGAWLRTLHESSFEGYEIIEFCKVADDLRGLLRKKALETTPYARLAREAFESARQMLSPQASLRVPVALNHGDFTLPNLIWNRDRQHLWVVDFELAARRGILHDLCSMIFELRRRLLHPLTSPRAIKQCEKSFWKGYGPIPKDLLIFANALATARIFYASLPRILSLRKRRGWLGGLKAALYKGLFQPFMLDRILQAR